MKPEKLVMEPSTWAGLGLLLQAVRFIVPPQWQLMVDALTGMAGTMSVGLREKGKAGATVAIEKQAPQGVPASAQVTEGGAVTFRPESGGG